MDLKFLFKSCIYLLRAINAPKNKYENNRKFEMCRWWYTRKHNHMTCRCELAIFSFLFLFDMLGALLHFTNFTFYIYFFKYICRVLRIIFYPQTGLQNDPKTQYFRKVYSQKISSPLIDNIQMARRRNNRFFFAFVVVVRVIIYFLNPTRCVIKSLR